MSSGGCGWGGGWMTSLGAQTKGPNGPDITHLGNLP